MHDAPDGRWSIGAFEIAAASVVHPGPTVGYRIEANGAAIAYLAEVRSLLLFHHDPDHADTVIDGLVEQARALRRGGDVMAASEGLTVEV